MSNFKSTDSSYKNRILVITSLVLVSALLLFQGLAGTAYSFKDNARTEEYNATVENIQDKNLALEDWIGAFQKTDRLSDPEAYVAVASKYNAAYLLAVHPELDIEKLRVARQLLVEALRVEPKDKDIRKNLELITAVLVEQVKEQLMDAGMSEEEAEATASEQEIGDLPSSGPEPGGESRGGNAY